MRLRTALVLLTGAAVALSACGGGGARTEDPSLPAAAGPLAPGPEGRTSRDVAASGPTLAAKAARLGTAGPKPPAPPPFAASRRGGATLVREGRLIGVQLEEFDAVVRPDGSTQPGFPLPIGTTFFLVEDLFLPAPASPQSPGAEKVGTGRTHCTVQPPRGLVLACEVTLALDGRGSLRGSEIVDFAARTPKDPLRADVAVVGGTGEFAGASGECVLADREDHDVSGVSSYDCRLAQPAALAAGHGHGRPAPPEPPA